MEWCYVWWPWLTSKRVAQVCQHQLSFLLPARRSKRGTCYSNVAGSLDVTRRYSINTVKPVLKLFQPSCSPIILNSSDPAPVPSSKGNPSAGALNSLGWGKLAIFDGNRRLCRKRYEIGRWLLWNVNRKSWVPDRMV